jgi:hypothetical protein
METEAVRVLEASAAPTGLISLIRQTCQKNVTFRRVRFNAVAMKKECGSVPLVMQHAKHIRCIILPSVSCLALQ